MSNPEQSKARKTVPSHIFIIGKCNQNHYEREACAYENNNDDDEMTWMKGTMGMVTVTFQFAAAFAAYKILLIHS